MPDGGIIEAIALAGSFAAANAGAIATTAVVVGTALSVAGAVTHDSTLSHIGMGLGLAGGVGGLAAASGMFAGEAGTMSIVQGATEGPVLPGQAALDAGTSPMASAAVGTGEGAVGSEANMVGKAAQSVGEAPNAVGSPTTPLGVGSAPPPPGGIAQSAGWDTPTTGQVENVPQGGSGSVNPAGESGFTPTAISGKGVASDLSTGNGFLANKLKEITPDTDIFGWWTKLDPTTKGMIAMTAGQGVAGAVGGMFQGMSASQRLQFDQLVNAQRQQIAQTQLSRATASPGIVQFGGQTPAGLPSGYGNPNLVRPF